MIALASIMWAHERPHDWLDRRVNRETSPI